jgi:heme oxygenase (biliverdin-IX-beta and delta-forming)
MATRRDWTEPSRDRAYRRTKGIFRQRPRLQRSHAFHSAIALALAAVDTSAIITRDEFRERTEFLARDLRDLGLPPFADIGLNGPLPRDPIDAVGVLYVTEGASLGARVLLIRAKNLGLGADHGARHLTMQARGFASWRRLVAVLDTMAIDASAEERLFTASLRTFGLAAAYFGAES